MSSDLITNEKKSNFERNIWPLVAGSAATAYFCQPLLVYFDPYSLLILLNLFSIGVTVFHNYVWYSRTSINYYLLLVIAIIFASTLIFNLINAGSMNERNLALCQNLYNKIKTMNGDYDKAATAFSSLSCNTAHKDILTRIKDAL